MMREVKSGSICLLKLKRCKKRLLFLHEGLQIFHISPLSANDEMTKKPKVISISIKCFL